MPRLPKCGWSNLHNQDLISVTTIPHSCLNSYKKSRKIINDFHKNVKNYVFLSKFAWFAPYIPVIQSIL